MEDDISSDLQASLTELQGTNNAITTREEGRVSRRSSDVDVPARRTAATDDLPATRRDQESSRRESLPANRQQDEEDTTDEERRQIASKEDEQTPARRTGDAAALERAPVTWRGPAKEEWKELSPTVRQEVMRRERQIDTTLTQTADQRRYAEVMFNAIAPYEIHLKAEGANHVQAVEHLMKMTHVMRAGTPQARARMLADLFFAHGVELALLDQYITEGMDGKPSQPARSDPMLQAIEQKLAPITNFMNEMQAARQVSTQRVAQGAAQTIQQLLDDPDIGDLVDDVREDMADLLELASKRGQILPLRDAALRAIMAHPEHSGVFNQRQLAKQAQQQTDKAVRARRAGASLQNEGAPPASENDDEDDGSVLGAIQASVRELSRRR